MSKSSNSSGVGVLGLLGVAFVVLKLTGYINWSWWWVLLPFYGGFTIFGALLTIGTLAALSAAALDFVSDKRKK